MKKFFFSLLMMIPLIGFISSCSNNEDDLPNVDFSYTYANAQLSDDTLYVVQGDTLAITGISVTNNESGKGAGITSATYFWDGRFVGPSFMPEFGCEFETNEMTSVGSHQIGIQCTVVAVGKEVATAMIAIPVEVVATSEDLPEPPAGDEVGDNGAAENPAVRVGSTITSGSN